jgi:PAS domain S-box-containing protein
MVRQEAAPPLLEAMSLEETQQTLHELRVHQIELEMQNAELRRAQLELEAARERDVHLYDQAPVGYVTVSEEGLILEANVAAAAMLGVARGALVERRLSQFIPPDDQNIYYFHRKQLFETGVQRTCELRMLKGDGSAFWTMMAAATAPDAEGVSVSYVTLSDITERRQAEEELRQSEVSLRAFFDNPGFLQGIVEVVNGDILHIRDNATAAQFFGRTVAEMHHARASEMGVPPETVRQWIAHYRDSQRTQLPVIFEYSHGQSKSVRHLRVVVTYLGGGVLGPRFTYAVEDFTERKQAEAATRKGDAYLRAITDAAQDAILIMNPQGLITYWNSAAGQLLGYTSAEALGKNVHSFLAPARYLAAHQAALPEFMRTGQGPVVNGTREMDACHKSGREVPVELSLSTLCLQDGWHAVGILRDITARRHADAEIQEANRRLATASARANEMAAQAKQASAAKGEFLANMSHEIRTPLNGVIGMTGLLLDTPLDDEQRRYAKTVLGSSEALLGVINDVLDFSKIEAGKLELDALDFDLWSLLDDVAAALALRSHHKGLELFCAADAAVPALVRGDPGRLRQILNNLAGNAIKFTAAGEVAIRVSLVEAAGPEVLLRFSVRDTGVGVPADKIGLLFDKFSQVDASISRKYGGSGLGLAISKQLTELMGGQIGMESSAGSGSEFWFTVRLGRQAGEAQKERSPATDLRDVRALIVDDNATGRDLLTIRLGVWGLRPVAVPDGLSALEALTQALAQHDPFRLALIDMQMPGMDGETLGRTIRADARLADTRMVLLTSLGMRGDARRLQEIGFAAYATKPIRYEELQTMLSLALPERCEATPAPIVTRHTARETRDQFAGRQARILLAEDNIVNQHVTLGILKKMGLHADVVTSGVDALRALESLPYDLVLMDVQMPELDGIEATRRIRQPLTSVRNPQIPVIALTANAMQGDRERFLAAGMNDHVVKPVSRRALAEALDRWLPPAATAPAPDASVTVAPEPEPEAPVSVLDRAILVARMRGDEVMAKEILAIFRDDMPRQITVLKACLERGDAAGVERQAHALKGAAANVGCERLREVASEMERGAEAGDLEAVTAGLTELDAQATALLAALDACL